MHEAKILVDVRLARSSSAPASAAPCRPRSTRAARSVFRVVQHQERHNHQREQKQMQHERDRARPPGIRVLRNPNGRTIRWPDRWRLAVSLVR